MSKRLVDELAEESRASERNVAELEGRLTQAVDALHRAQEAAFIFQTVVDQLPQSIFWKRREDLAYLGCNRRFAADASLASPAEIVGKRDHDLPWKEQADLYNTDDRRVMESEVSKLDYEEPQTQASGRTIWLRTSKMPLRDQRGQTVGVLGIYEDITAAKSAEEEQKRLRAEVESAQERALRELAAPLIPISQGVVALVLIGKVDEARGARIIEALLSGIEAYRASCALIDVTGVNEMGPVAARALVEAASAARLLGAQPILTGVNASLARAIVDMGAGLSSILTLGTLQAGIEFALRRAR